MLFRSAPAAPAGLGAIARQFLFWHMSLAFGLWWFAGAIVYIQIAPFLVEKGFGSGVAALALMPPLAQAIDEPFYLDLVARIMVFGLVALSLDLILGFGGMVSFGHAAGT